MTKKTITAFIMAAIAVIALGSAQANAQYLDNSGSTTTYTVYPASTSSDMTGSTSQSSTSNTSGTDMTSTTSTTTSGTTGTSGTGAAGTVNGTSGTTNTTPGLPNTGAGGDAASNIAALLTTGIIAGAGALYLRRHSHAA